MPQTWRPVIDGDTENYCRALIEFRDIFYTALGPHGSLKLFVPSAEGAPTKCTSTSERILSSLKGMYPLPLYYLIWQSKDYKQLKEIFSCH